MKIYTDGATSNNGKENAIGGWAYIILDDEENIIKQDSGKVLKATNQQMELLAVAKACEYAYLNLSEKKYNKEETFAVSETEFIIYTDSAYIINCNNQNWWNKWEQNGWINSKKEPVANKLLWKRLIPYFLHPFFTFIKVKGHSGDYWNEHVDQLAVKARLKLGDDNNY